MNARMMNLDLDTDEVEATSFDSFERIPKKRRFDDDNRDRVAKKKQPLRLARRQLEEIA